MTSTVSTEASRHKLRRAHAIFGGPLWWAVHLGGTYWLVPRACGMGTSWPLHVLTVAMVAACALAGHSAIQLRRSAADAGDELAQRREVYLGWSGLFLAIVFGAVTLFEGLPAWFLSPCA